MKTTIGLSLDFGRSGNAFAVQQSGWSSAEDGFTWTAGTESLLVIDKPDAPFGFIIEMELDPLAGSPAPASQRLRVFLDGTMVEDAALVHSGFFGVLVERPSIADGQLAIRFELPDAAPEAVGGRQLAFAFHGLRILILGETFSRPPAVSICQEVIRHGQDPEIVLNKALGISVSNLVLSFVNLAGDCEFGFLQRNCGVEPFDLLRFAGAPLASVIHGLDRLFEGIGTEIEPYLPTADATEWMILERKYNFAYHSGASPAGFGKPEIQKIEAKKLQLLRLRFLQELSGGGGFFVFVDKHALSEAEVLPLFLALRRRTSGWMLWVQLARTVDEVAEARLVIPGLVRGHLTRFSPALDGTDVSVRVWLNLLVNAWRLRLQVTRTQNA